jgi:hypothetical protein
VSANGVSTDLTAQNLVVDDTDWSGKARDAYLAAAGAQSTASGRVGTIAGSTSTSLLACAGAGALFYIVVAGVLFNITKALIAVIVAFGTAVFSWAGVLLFLTEAGINTTIIGAAVTTLTLFLASQATAMGFSARRRGGSDRIPGQCLAEVEHRAVQRCDREGRRRGLVPQGRLGARHHVRSKRRSGIVLATGRR